MRQLTIALLLFSVGCVSGFREEHYFRATDRRTGETVNYFRLTVQGRDGGTSSRFVAGLYDERAVDYFFNEIRTGETLQPRGTGPALSSNSVELQSLGDTRGSGAFVLILSTNAKSVADTLGEFAENQVIADAMTNLINRDAIRDQRKFSKLRQIAARRGESVRDHLDELFAELRSAPDASTAQNIALQIARTVSAASDDPVAFETMDEVRSWIRTQLALLPQEAR